MKKKPIFPIVYLTVAVLTLACSETKFNKRGWTAATDANLPPIEREKMLHDLLANHTLVGLKYADIIDLLGDPDGVDSSALSYTIELDYGTDIDPIYRKDLSFSMTDSLVAAYEIKEWSR